MPTILLIIILSGLLALLSCVVLPVRNAALVRKVGTWLPWYVLLGSIIAAVATWVNGGSIQIPLATASGSSPAWTWVYLDALSATIFVLVAFLGAIISRFSIHYLSGEPREAHFFKWLCVTLGSVLWVVIAGNFLIFTLAWMMTSLSLHQLLVFYPDRKSARLAAKKKFVISRIGDLCLIGAGVGIFTLFGTLNFPEILQIGESIRQGQMAHPGLSLHVVAFLIVMGALLKSAQFPFHTWLPDTLETPTPVSALMHAGIINGGGFLIIRMSELLVASSISLTFLAVVGGFTAVFAGLVMLTQTSVKKSLAFSTVAQMGFMMLQCGLGAFALATLHIVAHSLYKAYAFLSSGTLPEAKPESKPAKTSVLMVLPAVFVATFVFALIGSITGTLKLENSYSWILGWVVALGLTQLLLQARSTHPGGWSGKMGIAAAMLIGLATVQAFFHAGANLVLADAVAASPVFQSGWQQIALWMIALLFTAGFMLPLLGAKNPSAGWYSNLRLHASHGFYCNTWVNRLFQHRLIGSQNRPLDSNAIGAHQPADLQTADLQEAIAKIAPLWPLDHFVAVNPYLGFSSNDISKTAAYLQHSSGAKVFSDSPVYLQKLETEAITDNDLEEAYELSCEEVKRSLQEAGISPVIADVRTVLSMSGSTQPRYQEDTGGSLVFQKWLDGEPDGYWQRTMAEQLSRWCAFWFETPSASFWPVAEKSQSLYQDWIKAMREDLNPEVAGIAGFREAMKVLPDHAEQAIAQALAVLGVPQTLHEAYLYANLFELRGWAGYCQYLNHNAKLGGSQDHTIVDLLAIILITQALLYISRNDEARTKAWQENLVLVEEKLKGALSPEIAVQSLMQTACESKVRDQLVKRLTATSFPDFGKPELSSARLQAVFCIDVRSEIYRRALEAQSDDIETIGFAGFFGLPIAYASQAHTKATARCPVLLSPSVPVHSACTMPIENPAKHFEAWQTLQKNTPSCFTYVEALGIPHLFKVLSSSFPSQSITDGNKITPNPVMEIDLSAKTTAAASLLKHLGLTKGFAKTVLFVGHGSHTENNPHASSLDCGACGGHAGDVNARVAAALMNEPQVRLMLAQKHQIYIPEETCFAAGLHNTTTDEVTLYAGDAPEWQTQDHLAEVDQWLKNASTHARKLRAPQLGIDENKPIDEAVKYRSVDWSQTRPEWGLAGNYAFIAAPRHRTRHMDLKGQVFLHNYDAVKDPAGDTLQLILTAPVVVASWINLQYYASTVDNAHFGSGSKVIHNIASRLGVLGGNGGDILTGLPVQSIAAPDKPMHSVLRLHVFVEASQSSIDRVLEENASIRQLVENRWLHLFSMSEDGRSVHQCRPEGGWQSVASIDREQPLEACLGMASV
jgi:uncharacterized protein YbcC (UPF0753/DUF2309 family)/NADH:ubiquinone oxidoreductase subunit 5 (subunit L)/multisubunit Na+/H+ antiporter MnhA subunit